MVFSIRWMPSKSRWGGDYRFCLVDVEEDICFDVVNEAGLGIKDTFYNDFEEETYISIEIIFYFGLCSGCEEEYLPGRCFCSRNHLLLYSPNLL